MLFESRQRLDLVSERTRRDAETKRSENSLDVGQGKSCLVSDGEGVSRGVLDVKVGDGSAG